MNQTLKNIIKPFAFAAARTAMKLSGNRVLSPNGWLIYNVSPTTNGQDAFSLALGRYEKAEISMLRENFTKCAAIIEIGGNIGIVTRHAIETALETSGTMVVMEPNPRSISTLETNIARSTHKDPTKLVSVVEAAIATPARNGDTAQFDMRPNLSSGLEGQVVPQGNEEKATVALRSLGSVIREFGLDADREISLVCDAEGGEFALLEDPALDLITQAAIEFHEPLLTGRYDMPIDVAIKQFENRGLIAQARASNTVYFRRAPKGPRVT